ncbi:MAG TPA: hypothetical protein ACFE0H_03605 [Elainellaceae cyanobacterium]
MDQHSKITSLSAYIKNHPDELSVWIESQAAYAALIKHAKQERVLTTLKPSYWKRVVQFIRSLVSPDLHSLHGNAYVDSTLVKDIKVKTWLIAGINALTILPVTRILFVPFSSLGLLSLPLALTFSSLSLSIMNGMAQRVITEWTRETRKRWVNLAGLALLQGFISSLAGPSLFLTTDEPYLTQLWAVRQAEEVIQARYEAGLKQISLLNTARDERQTRCNELTERILELPEGSPERNILFLEAFGFYADLDQDRSQIPTEQLRGECHIAEGYTRDAQALQQQLIQVQTDAEEQLRQVGPLAYLEQEAPDIYALHFSETGSLLSGSLKAELATDLFIQRIRHGELGAVLIPMLLFAISMITSAAMVLKLESFRRRADVQRSFDSRIALLRDELFYQAQLGLLNQLHALEEVDALSDEFQQLD